MFEVGDECTIWLRDRVVGLVTVSNIKLTWFVTSDGTRWRAEVGEEARRVPEGPDAPTLRPRRKGDVGLYHAQVEFDEFRRRPYQPPPTGLSGAAVLSAMRSLGVRRPS